MIALSLNELRRYEDILRLPDRTSLTVRFVEPRDAHALQDYFRSLPVRSRYNRFLGAVSELSQAQLDDLMKIGEGGHFSVIAVMKIDGVETIVGEARYAFEVETGRFKLALSVDDRWQGRHVGSTLLGNLECRAAALGATTLFGDTLRTNGAMIGLARQSGYTFVPSPGDWRQVRFEKLIAQNFSTQGRNSSSQVQALRGCCSTFQ
jgi:GNAT superfamily N-acetyltransferase